MSGLTLHFLGTPSIELEGAPVSISHSKAVALLAYLAVTQKRYTREALAALLWPDYDLTSARGEVRRMIWVLNKSLGQGWLVADRQTVQLPSQADLWLDVDHFRQLLAKGQHHDQPVNKVCPACLEPLTKAVALVRGDFLAGLPPTGSPEFEAWQLYEAETLRRELAGALERLVQLHLSGVPEGKEQAIAYARRWLALDSLHEPAHRQLMQLYAWTGQPAAAIRQYQECVRLLGEELDVLPAAETTALYEAIKANRLPPPAGVAEQKYMETTPVSPVSPGPSVPPHSLPVQATPFIGRTTDLADLDQRLADPDVHLITITGPGGIGKTRLALALAERQLQARPQLLQPTLVQPGHHFSNGIYFVSLTPISSTDFIAQAIAEGLNFPLSAGGTSEVQLLDYLRTRQMLLVLDNFEHLLAGAGLVSDIIQAAPRVKILVTSRERLNLAEEIVWNVTGLGFAELETMEDALAYEAVQLFIQSARRVRADFSLRAIDLPDLNLLLRILQGMPLAIELAAAWLNMFSVAKISAEICQSLDLLETGLRNVPDRHRSIRAVFAHSWNRLTEEEQVLFKVLSVFRGGFTRQAAQQITGASLRTLAGLVNKSLLISHPDIGRYEIHELLRQYAQEQLANDDPQISLAIREAHAAYYARLMQRGWADLRSSKQKVALAEIEQDIENIRAAWRYRLAEKNSAELLNFMDSFWLVYDVRGWHHTGIELFEEAADQLHSASGDDTATLVFAKALGYIGYYTGIVGHPEQGLALSKEAVALIRPLNQPEALLYALQTIALNGIYLDESDQVVEVAEEFGQIGKEIGDRWGETISLNFLATALASQKKLVEAREKADRALQIFGQEICEYFGLTWAALVRGLVAITAGAYKEAKPFYERSLKAAQALNYRRTTQQSYDNLGDVAFHLGEVEQAEEYFRRSLGVSEETGQKREMVITLYDIAKVWAVQGKKAQALELVTMVLHHPLSALHLFLRTEDTPLREAAERLRAEMEANLEPETYQAAWNRGQTLQLEEVVADLLR